MELLSFLEVLYLNNKPNGLTATFPRFFFGHHMPLLHALAQALTTLAEVHHRHRVITCALQFSQQKVWRSLVSYRSSLRVVDNFSNTGYCTITCFDDDFNKREGISINWKYPRTSKGSCPGYLPSLMRSYLCGRTQGNMKNPMILLVVSFRVQGFPWELELTEPI